MQFSFDPRDAQQRLIARAVCQMLDNHEVDGTNAMDVDTPDNRDAAAVFASAPAQSVAPLPMAAPSTAVAGQLPTAPAGLPALPPVAPTAGQPPAWLAPGQAAAPSANAQPMSPAGVEVDTTGLPWDVRIHAGTKRRNADGTWTAKKGINDPALVARVTAELRAVQALPLTAGAPTAAAPTPAPAPVAAAPLPPLQLPATLPPLLPQVAAPTVPANFDELMPRVTAAVAAGLIPENALLAAVQARQLPSLVALTARPDFVPVIWQDMQTQYPALV